MALNLLPDSLKSQLVFPCIDDTMVPKFGRKFEDVSKLFDHAAYNGSNYLIGHCFESLMLCVPVWNKGKVVYPAVPLGYHMGQKSESKLELAADMVRLDLIGNARSDSVLYDFSPHRLGGKEDRQNMGV